MDIDDIPPGVDFVEHIDRHVSRCDILLAVIDSAWIGARDAHNRRRLDDPSDFVRIEIATALRRSIRVVPVLIDGAQMPNAQDLPNELKPLVRRQATRITHEKFTSDVWSLAKDLRPALSWRGRALRWLKNRSVLPPEEAPIQKAPRGALIPTQETTFPLTEVERFFAERIVTAEGASITATELYEEYTRWCENDNRQPLALPTFGREFGELGVQRAKVNGRVRYIGILFAARP